MTWVVCGPPRSATTFMLEAVAVYTDLEIQWNVRSEWESRKVLPERFYENGDGGAGVVVKVLDPDRLPAVVSGAVLMVRDPVSVSASAAKIGQLIPPEHVTARVDEFRHRLAGRVVEVDIAELVDLDSLFRRLASAGWPVLPPCHTMATRAARPGREGADS